MTNADKYLKDGVDVEELATEINELMLFCQNYAQPFRACLVEFFNKPLKPTLTEDEKVILRNALESGADAILRNDKGIYFHTKPGIKGIFGNRFQFIQHGEEYSIKELLGDE